ncbi:MAG: hypothetical protein Q8O89_09150 [Nanoarchaeota archaeon]|nr:hypothetical protein [Nanoarchaeota archaeon]
MITFRIEPILFNNAHYSVIEILDSAEKHFGNESKKYFSYIVQYLKDQHWEPIEKGNDGQNEFITASVTSSIRPALAQSDYRKTAFRIYPESQKIVFFHGSSIKKSQFELAQHKFIYQIMETGEK